MNFELTDCYNKNDNCGTNVRLLEHISDYRLNIYTSRSENTDFELTTIQKRANARNYNDLNLQKCLENAEMIQRPLSFESNSFMFKAVGGSGYGE